MSSRWISVARNSGQALVAAFLLLAAGAAQAQSGAPAAAMRYPYIAALYRDAGSGQVYFCAGTMVAPQWIATAAHCFYDRGGQRIADIDLGAVVGRDRLGEAGKEAQVEVARVEIHPDYDPVTQANDVALIRLTEIAGPLIARVASLDDDEPAAATVLGFGSFYEGELAGQALTATGAPAAQSSDRLRQAVVTSLDPSRCAGITGGKTELDPTRICAGAGPRDACVGDSGGPLVIPGPDADRLIGIVSLGSGCAVADPVVVYTRVADYAPWIEGLIATR